MASRKSSPSSASDSKHPPTPSRPKSASGTRRAVATDTAAGAAEGEPSHEREAERAELSQLDEQIRYHERAYRDGAAEVSDAVFDELMERYAALADRLEVPAGERLDAQPGADHTEGFVTVEHRMPMLSL